MTERKLYRKKNNNSNYIFIYKCYCSAFSKQKNDFCKNSILKRTFVYRKEVICKLTARIYVNKSLSIPFLDIKRTFNMHGEITVKVVEIYRGYLICQTFTTLKVIVEQIQLLTDTVVTVHEFALVLKAKADHFLFICAII